MVLHYREEGVVRSQIRKKGRERKPSKVLLDDAIARQCEMRLTLSLLSVERTTGPFAASGSMED